MVVIMVEVEVEVQVLQEQMVFEQQGGIEVTEQLIVLVELQLLMVEVEVELLKVELQVQGELGVELMELLELVLFEILVQQTLEVEGEVLGIGVEMVEVEQ